MVCVIAWAVCVGELVTIVHPDTLRRWIRDSQQKAKRKPVKKGRPRTQEQIRELILKLARENDWGYTRILGELRKLGIKAVSRNTVKNILKENGLDPGPKRGAGTWDEFLKIHAATLWQCDFYAKKVLTAKGLRDLYLLIFLHVETRRVFIAPATYHPNEAWVKQQAEAFLQHTKETGLSTAIVMHDRDTKFTALSGVGTNPRPKRLSQTRLTNTRTVSGLSTDAIQSASSNRPLPVDTVGVAAPQSTCKNPRGTFAPGFSTSPRMNSSESFANVRSRTPIASTLGVPSTSYDLSLASSVFSRMPFCTNSKDANCLFFARVARLARRSVNRAI